MLKMIFIFGSIIFFASIVSAGTCNEAKGTVNNQKFTIVNSLSSPITLALYQPNTLTPSSNSSLAPQGSFQSSNSNIIQICAYTTSNISSHVTQTKKVACCNTNGGFIGSTITFTGSHVVTNQGKAVSNQSLTV